MKLTVKLLPLILTSFIAGCSDDPNSSNSNASSQPTITSNATLEPEHFHPLGKSPSEHTKNIQAKHRELLPFADTRDIDENTKGFIAAPEYRQIMNDKGGVAWDMGRFDFLLEEGKDFDSMHPSLQRQAILNMAYGLYEVLPEKIYQVRGYDLANITFIKGDTGWIVFDPLTAEETARAALQFINEQLGERPVVGVVYSHAHIDHFAGVKGVTNVEDVASGKTQIFAPENFMQYAIAENVYAGNAMIRRANYQYGQALPASPFGYVDAAIGKAAASGNPTLIAPTISISNNIEEYTLDGVKMIFQNTPGTEAPAEMNTYFPEWKAFWAAENITATIHNIYTLRGALVRDALAWSQEINRAIYLFNDAEVMFASHSWPRWGNDRIMEVMKAQRDMYAHLNNQVLHLANAGVTINEIHNVYEVPTSLKNQWPTRSYHGSEFINSRAIINRYLGYWDGNPSTLTPLSPADSAPLYVEMMGGSAKIINKGQQLYNDGQYLLAMEPLNKLVYAEPNNVVAKHLLADVFEQLGYQYESTSVRHSYLAAAKELRDDVQPAATTKSSGPDLIQAMSTQMFLEFIAIRMDSKKAEDLEFVINLVTPDNGEKFVLELSNATLTVIEGFSADDANLTITVDRADLEQVMMGVASFSSLIENKQATTEGDLAVLSELASRLVEFDPFFEMMPGTKSIDGTKVPSEETAFEHKDTTVSGE